jgi:hypothetical protein
MPDNASLVLGPWSNFYVIAGSSAAGLSGLMFVVITLVVGIERTQTTADGIATFSTPTVLHFCVALVVSAVMSAPWRSIVGASATLGLIGLYGILYVLRIVRRAKRQTAYRPDLEDWLWYSILPFLAYIVLSACALLLLVVPAQALFALAGAIVLLILIGIHNAWDIVTYIALGNLNKPRPQETPSVPDESSEQSGPGGS